MAKTGIERMKSDRGCSNVPIGFAAAGMVSKARSKPPPQTPDLDGSLGLEGAQSKKSRQRRQDEH
jgi:hypothetical protein